MRALPFLLIGLVLGLGASYLRHGGGREVPVAAPGGASESAAPREAGRAVEPPVRAAELREPGAGTPAELEGPSVHDRLDEILARLEAIEARLDGQDRRPIGGGEGPVSGSDDLRAMVVAVLNEAAEAERLRDQRDERQAELDAVEKRRGEIRFQVGMALAEMRQEIVLDDGQKEAVIAAVVEMEERRWKIQDFDPATMDPEVFQREVESIEDDFWRRLENDLGVDLAARLREHF